MKVVVTGATSPLGRRICADLLQAGHEVVAVLEPLGALPSGWPLVGGSGARGTLRRVDADLTSDAAVLALRPELGPSVALIHLAEYRPAAGEASQGLAAGAPRLEARRCLLELNVRGTMRVLEAARAPLGGARVVILGSSADVMTPAGGSGAGARTEQRFQVRPHGDYAISKLAAEDHLVSFGDEENTPIVVLRVASGAAPAGESRRDVLPVVRAAIAGSVRGFVDVDVGTL